MVTRDVSPKAAAGRNHPMAERSPDATVVAGGAMGDLMLRLDWSGTPLGPAAGWSQSLRTAVSILLASRFPMIAFWGDDLVQLYNDAYRPILGATKHPSALGQRAIDCWPEIWEVVGPMLEGVLRTGRATWSDNQLLLLDRNGYVEECYFTFSYSPIRAEEAVIGGVFCAVTETTAHVIGERRLRTFRDLAAVGMADTEATAAALSVAALDTNPVDIPFAVLYCVEDDGTLARLAAVTGISAGSAVSPTEVVLNAPLPAPDPYVRPMIEAVRTCRPVLIDRLPQGATIAPGRMDAPQQALVVPVSRRGVQTPAALLVVGLNPHRALDDDYRGFLELVAGQIATALDRARAGKEAQERLEALAELNRAKTLFFSNISHEFRTPLTLLLAPVEDALADAASPLPVVHQDRLEIVRRNGLRLLRLVNALLDFSRLEAGRMEATYRPTDLAALTADLAAAFRSPIEHAGLRFTVTCPPLPQPVYVDRACWEKIVLNLLSNAFKFTFSGSIDVASRITDGQFELTVTDSGVGITEAELPRIFERFHRVTGVPSRTQEGSGIGLAIVRELVGLHGGDITVASTPGRGSTFNVRLRCGAEHLPAEQIGEADGPTPSMASVIPQVEEAQQWLRTSLPAAGPPGAQRLLLVDDNADMRQYLTSLLGKQWQVATAADGTTALAAARERPPDLVLTDVMMPGMDGFQLLRALRADVQTRDVPVILLSARAGEEATIEGLDAGADDYLIKPFTARELVARVRTHLELAYVRKEAARLREQALVEAQEAVRQRDEFVTTAAHDLRNPLTAMHGYVQLLQRHLRGETPPDADRLNSYLVAVQDSVTAMREQIDELHDLAQLQVGKVLDLHRSNLDLFELLQHVIAAQQQTTDDHKITLVAAPTPILGDWDPMRLRRVIANLLDNAVKYSPAGTTVQVAIAQTDGDLASVTLTVHDDGVGIPLDELPYIFERDRRGRNVGQFDGSGIGLASARQIVEQHGGNIGVESQEGQGSTFTVRLPLRPPA